MGTVEMTTETIQQQLGDPSTWPLLPWATMFSGNQVVLPVCPVCGAACRNAAQHAAWHEALGQ